MNLNVTFDQSVSSLPTAFVSAVDYVVNLYDQLFANPVTVNIHVGYGEIDGGPIPAGDLSASQAYYTTVSYSKVSSLLSALGTPGGSTLPPTNPSGDTMYMTTAEQKALGLMPANDSALDGYIGISTSFAFSDAPGVTPAQGEYYLIGAIEHEISEDMGRVSLLNPLSFP